jgi:hypothetical protein
MATILQFRKKSELPSCVFTRCDTKLMCPACDFTACSTTELYMHMQEVHPPQDKPEHG